MSSQKQENTGTEAKPEIVEKPKIKPRKGKSDSNSEPEELGYIAPPISKGHVDYSQPQFSWMSPEATETFAEKAMRKTKQNPFVPIGLGVTVCALSYGLWQMKTGDKVMSQKMMRLRVAAQSFTVVALLGGVAYEMYKKKNSATIALK